MLSILKIKMNKKYNFNESFFETIDTEEKAYWLGFIAADGNINDRGENKSKSLHIGLSFKDKNHLLKFMININYSHLLIEIKERIINLKKRRYVRLNLNSKKMYNDLLDKGITPRKSLTLKPPKNVPKDLVRHWIRGYFDGDGSVHIYNDKRDKH